MNLKTVLTVVTALFTTLVLTGCAASATDAEVKPSAVAGAETEPRCNLGIEIDSETHVVVPRYEAPPADSYEVRNYGPLVADIHCSDAEILAWQDLRREQGEADNICRPVIAFSVDGVGYPIGCAVPQLVVTDASR